MTGRAEACRLPAQLATSRRPLPAAVALAHRCTLWRCSESARRASRAGRGCGGCAAGAGGAVGRRLGAAARAGRQLQRRRRMGGRGAHAHPAGAPVRQLCSLCVGRIAELIEGALCCVGANGPAERASWRVSPPAHAAALQPRQPALARHTGGVRPEHAAAPCSSSSAHVVCQEDDVRVAGTQAQRGAKQVHLAAVTIPIKSVCKLQVRAAVGSLRQAEGREAAGAGGCSARVSRAAACAAAGAAAAAASQWLPIRAVLCLSQPAG